MSKIVRKTALIFGQNAGFHQLAQFGSLAAGSPMFSTDPAVLQALSNWLEGWFSAVLGSNSPAIEDVNTAFYVLAYQIAYLMQEGIPEWDSGTTYYIGSVVQYSNVHYMSLIDTNLNVTPGSNHTDWVIIGGQIATAPGDMLYANSHNDLVRLPAGAQYQVLQMGASAVPYWRYGFIGSAAFVGNTSFSVAGSPTSLTHLTAGTATAPTVVFNPVTNGGTGPTILTTTSSNLQVTVNNLPAGFYKVTYKYVVEHDSGNASFAISDGTNLSGYAGFGVPTWNSCTTIGFFEYGSSGNQTFELVGGTSASTSVRGDNSDASGWRIDFSIEQVA